MNREKFAQAQNDDPAATKKTASSFELQLQSSASQHKNSKNQSRQKNLITDVLIQDNSQPWSDTEQQVRDFLSTKLKISPTNIQTENIKICVIQRQLVYTCKGQSSCQEYLTLCE